MNQALIIGDTHLDDRYEGYLEAQINSLKWVADEYDIETVVFLGDLSEKRKPKPRILLAIQELLSYYKKRNCKILRGNHDANDKSDDGLTYLTLFESKKVKIFEHIGTAKLGDRKFTFIPHYENEQIIIDAYNKLDKDHIVFGHFGYTGCLNGVPDYAFTIPPSCINNYSILGHLHRNSTRGNINVVGTPYPTTFYDFEYNTGSVAILEYDQSHQNLYLAPVKHGPRYYTVTVDKLNDLKVDGNNFNLLRVLLDSDSDKYGPDIIKEMIAKYGFKWVDLRVVPKVTSKLQTLSEGAPMSSLIDKSVLDQFLDTIKLPYEREDLMKVYSHIKNEN